MCVQAERSLRTQPSNKVRGCGRVALVVCAVLLTHSRVPSTENPLHKITSLVELVQFMAYPGGEHNEVNVNTFVVRVPSRRRVLRRGR